MASSSPSKATLSALPVELVDRIFWLVDKPDLVNLRFVSKSICAIANRPFAVRNFTHSHQVITKHSMKTLLAVSAHKVFGAYIKSIMISPACRIIKHIRPDDIEEENTVVDDSLIESGRFGKMVHRIFVNLRQHSASIRLGVLEDIYLGCNYRLASQHTRRCHGRNALQVTSPRGISFRTSETLELVIAAMQVAGLNIGGLNIELSLDTRENPKCRTNETIESNHATHPWI
ncbi:unnamed protein product [Aureobasidium uvarum]|uniref:F-box domain-containing protein n=1 Tax=Aureobasidium uvarum TaxID=2773716 RepID=A0A9N8KM96_9PEZI|nr:unnamed protein product [Aureobasidium uvarum]